MATHSDYSKVSVRVPFAFATSHAPDIAELRGRFPKIDVQFILTDRVTVGCDAIDETTTEVYDWTQQHFRGREMAGKA